MNCILSFDIGGTFVKWGIINKSKIIIDDKFSTPQKSLDEFLKEISKIIRRCESKYSLDGLAFSLPGTMNTKMGYIVHGGSLRYFDGINMKEVINRKFNMKCSIQNDARSAAMAELTLGSLQNIDDALVCVLGTGFGGAIINDRKILHGTNLYAGEFSMIVENIDNKKQFLGNLLSVPALVKRAGIVLGINEFSGEELIELVKKGDGRVLPLFDEYLERFVNALISLQFIFAPEKLLLGEG
ncbi:ROK family protein [Companilactobacillus kimchii]|uniref:ROK family protein n=1 Tax=Companilactobacillus kimchii TaxID=2801452 RepID=UPI0006D1941D|nr:ROK family protein [Companilactobacillus kimchii]